MGLRLVEPTPRRVTGADQINLDANLKIEITGARHGWGNETELVRLNRQEKKNVFFSMERCFFS